MLFLKSKKRVSAFLYVLFMMLASLFIFAPSLSQGEIKTGLNQDKQRFTVHNGTNLSYRFEAQDIAISITGDFNDSSSDLLVWKDKGGLNIESSSLTTLKNIRLRTAIPEQPDIVSLVVNGEDNICVFKNLKSNINECYPEPGSEYSPFLVKSDRLISVMFLPTVIFVSYLIGTIQRKKTSKETQIELNGEVLVWLMPVFVSVLIFWLPPYADALSLTDNTPVQGLWSAFNSFDLSHPLGTLTRLVRGVLASIFGVFFEARIYFSGIVLLTFWSYKNAAKKLFDNKAKIYLAAVGALAITNPFFLQRLLLGQSSILAAYVVFPWFVFAVVDYIKSTKNMHRLVLLSILVASLSIHMIPLLTITLTTLVIYKLIRKEPVFAVGGSVYYRLSAYLAGVFIIFMQLVSAAAKVFDFNNYELLFWAPTSDAFYGIQTTLLSGVGYWTDGALVDIVPSTRLWPVLSFIPLVLGLGGLYIFAKEQKDNSGYMLILFAGLFSLLGFGIFDPSGIFETLYSNWLLRGLRESQKLYVFLWALIPVFSVYAVGKTRFAKYGLLALIICQTGWLVGAAQYNDSRIAQCNVPAEVINHVRYSDNKIISLPSKQIDILDYCNSKTSQNVLSTIIGAQQKDVEQLDYTNNRAYSAPKVSNIVNNNREDDVILLHGQLLPRDIAIEGLHNHDRCEVFDSFSICKGLVTE